MTQPASFEATDAATETALKMPGTVKLAKNKNTAESIGDEMPADQNMRFDSGRLV